MDSECTSLLPFVPRILTNLAPFHSSATGFSNPGTRLPKDQRKVKKMRVLFSHDFKIYINYYQSLLPDERSGFYVPYTAEALRQVQTNGALLLYTYI